MFHEISISRKLRWDHNQSHRHRCEWQYCCCLSLSDSLSVYSYHALFELDLHFGPNYTSAKFHGLQLSNGCNDIALRFCRLSETNNPTKTVANTALQFISTTTFWFVDMHVCDVYKDSPTTHFTYLLCCHVFSSVLLLGSFYMM